MAILTSMANPLGTMLEYPIQITKTECQEWIAKWLLDNGQASFAPFRHATWVEQPNWYGPGTEAYALNVLFHFGMLEAHRDSYDGCLTFQITQRGLDFLKEEA